MVDFVIKYLKFGNMQNAVVYWRQKTYHACWHCAVFMCSNSYLSVSKPFFFIIAKLLSVQASVIAWGFVSKEEWSMKYMVFPWTSNISLCMNRKWPNFQKVLAGLNSRFLAPVFCLFLKIMWLIFAFLSLFLIILYANVLLGLINVQFAAGKHSHALWKLYLGM